MAEKVIGDRSDFSPEEQAVRKFSKENFGLRTVLPQISGLVTLSGYGDPWLLESLQIGPQALAAARNSRTKGPLIAGRQILHFSTAIGLLEGQHQYFVGKLNFDPEMSSVEKGKLQKLPHPLFTDGDQKLGEALVSLLQAVGFRVIMAKDSIWLSGFVAAQRRGVAKGESSVSWLRLYEALAWIENIDPSLAKTEDFLSLKHELDLCPTPLRSKFEDRLKSSKESFKPATGVKQVNLPPVPTSENQNTGVTQVATESTKGKKVNTEMKPRATKPVNYSFDYNGDRMTVNLSDSNIRKRVGKRLTEIKEAHKFKWAEMYLSGVSSTGTYVHSLREGSGKLRTEVLVAMAEFCSLETSWLLVPETALPEDWLSQVVIKKLLEEESLGESVSADTTEQSNVGVAPVTEEIQHKEFILDLFKQGILPEEVKSSLVEAHLTGETVDYKRMIKQLGGDDLYLLGEVVTVFSMTPLWGLYEDKTLAEVLEEFQKG